jgi:F-type H+-transporting ATPase subunit c
LEVNKVKAFMMFTLTSLFATAAFAQVEPTVVTTGAGAVLWGPLAAAFVLGVAALGGSLGQGRAVAAACEAIARNPGAAGAIRLAMIIGLALIESLVIYALIIAFIAVNR